MIDSSHRPDPEQLAAFRQVVARGIERDLERERDASESLRGQVLAGVRAGIAAARREHLCGEAWLFGSYAWGEPNERSDVDLLLAHCADPDLVAAIVGRHTRTEVHAVPESDAPAGLRERVVAHGVPL